MPADRNLLSRLRDTATALAEANWPGAAETVREGTEEIERLTAELAEARSERNAFGKAAVTLARKLEEWS